MTLLVYVKDLDTEKLKTLMRLDPGRIVAEEATPEAIKTCRMIGMDLLLVPGNPDRKCDCGELCSADAAYAQLELDARRLGVRLVIGQSDIQGFRRGLSLTEDKSVH